MQRGSESKQNVFLHKSLSAALKAMRADRYLASLTAARMANLTPGVSHIFRDSSRARCNLCKKDGLGYRLLT